jgi:hypothetical protein
MEGLVAAESILNAHLTDDLLVQVFDFLAPRVGATLSSGMMVGFQELALVCRRWKRILYQPEFWQTRLATPAGIGQSLKLASDSAPPHFFGFRRLEGMPALLPIETRFLVDELATGRRLVLSSVRISEGERPHALVAQLQRRSHNSCTNHSVKGNGQLWFLRCTLESGADHSNALTRA